MGVAKFEEVSETEKPGPEFAGKEYVKEQRCQVEVTEHAADCEAFNCGLS
jgi:hypothetical protein